LQWDENTELVEGYRVYAREHWASYDYDSPVWAGSDTTCTIFDLAEGVSYYFVARAFNEFAESGNSNEVSMLVSESVSEIGVRDLETGRFESTGKGKNKTQNFVLTETFDAGDAVVLRLNIEDVSTGLPVANAIAEISINDSENTILISEPTGTDGIAEATWRTSAPRGKRKKSGTTPGTYQATVTNSIADDYMWDGDMSVTTFVIQ
jgi:hypothetical protein